MLRALYTLGIFMYVSAIRWASPFHTKAALWVRGRKNWEARMKALFMKEKRPVIWIHCASYGEFEQGRPLIEKIFLEKKEYFILITFFSPSGKEAFSSYDHAHAVEYLPEDLPQKVYHFMDIVRPVLAVFIRYEFWLNYLRELRRRKIPHFLVSAVFKEHHPFFRWYGKIFRESLEGFSEIFVQDRNSYDLLKKIGLKDKVSVQGDSRIDRVLSIRREKTEFRKEGFFPEGGEVLVAGSVWEEDVRWLIRWWGRWKLDFPGLYGVLVPHEVDERTVRGVIRLVEEGGFTWAMWGTPFSGRENFIIVDKMGLLSRMYAMGDWAYVGGAMGKGIHNILEPAVYGIPVICCGHHFSNFVEAEELRELSALKVYHPEEDASGGLSQTREKRNEIREVLQKYFENKAGATGKIFEKIFTRFSF